MAAPKSDKAKEELLLRWGRDLSTCTAAEILVRWPDSLERRAIDTLDPATFAGRLVNHNPIYFLAERCWFDNVATDPTFLYPPFHRDRVCEPIMRYILATTAGIAGLLAFRRWRSRRGCQLSLRQ